MRNFRPPAAFMKMSWMNYLKYTPEVEHRRADEDEIVAKIVDELHALNAVAYDKHQHATRDAHAKSHGVLRGDLTVYPDLPGVLRQGLFGQPASYPVMVRLSTAAGEIRSDQIAGLRGFAVKVLGVPGPRALPDDDTGNQDFLLVNKPTIPFGHVEAYLAAMRLAKKQAKVPDAALKVAGVVARTAGHVLDAVQLPKPAPVAGLGMPNTHILGETFHSMAALRYGDYLAKISAAPLSEPVRTLTGVPIDRDGDGVLRELVVDFFRDNAAEYELRAQLCTDISTMPVEDASVLWPESESPHLPIAKLSFPPQDAGSAARRVYADDVLSFNPWHALAAHRPLGSIMRVRRQAYEASTSFRHAMNAVPRVEPRSIEELPG
ncbi:catalase family protein [Amycolatopsis sp. SID8362]|uniref:catalase family protein n=1 Tax=Amycolatopsis sp. SID8362 TaxID=2690346 RepID=UPI001EF20440|nr:catalase family protein [Amycolatopsis sp. SID8362]